MQADLPRVPQLPRINTESVELDDGAILALIPLESGRTIIAGIRGPMASATLGALTIDQLFDLSVAAAKLAQDLQRRAEFAAMAPGGYSPQPAMLADAGLVAGISLPVPA